MAGRLTDALWRGQVQTVILAIEELVHRAGAVRDDDPHHHPRRLRHQNLGYFQRHAQHMNYPEYRKRGWPTPGGRQRHDRDGHPAIQQTRQRYRAFWHDRGVEPILALRALWLSHDDRWHHH